MRAYVILRVSAEDQKRGSGFDSQWEDDVLLGAEELGLEVKRELCTFIDERATTSTRPKYEAIVSHVIDLFREDQIEAILYPRVDRETRYIFGSIELLKQMLDVGIRVFFARECFQLDPHEPDSVNRYLDKVKEAQSYVYTMTVNTSRGRKKRAKRGQLPNGQCPWWVDYNARKNVPEDQYTGKPTLNRERVQWVRKWAEWIVFEGISLAELGRRVKDVGLLSPKGCDSWSRSDFTRILGNEAVLGIFYNHKTEIVRGRRQNVPREQWRLVFQDESLRVLPDEVFYAVQQRLQENQELSKRNTKYDYTPIRGFVFCLCKRKMEPVPTHGVPYFRCPVCRKPMVQAKQTWEEVKTKIIDLLLDPDRLVAGVRQSVHEGHNISQLQDEIDLREAELQALDSAETKLIRLYANLQTYSQDKLDAEMVQVRAKQYRAQTKLGELRPQLEETRQACVDEVGLRYFCQLAENNITNLSDRQWSLILKMLNVRVVPGGKGLTLVNLWVPSVSEGFVLQHS